MKSFDQAILGKLKSLEKYFPIKDKINLHDALIFIENTVHTYVNKDLVLGFLKEKGYKVDTKIAKTKKIVEISKTQDRDSEDDLDIDELLNIELNQTQSSDSDEESDYASNICLLSSYQKNKDVRTYQELVKNNSNLVKKIAYQYSNYLGNHKLDYDDLVSEGTIGLTKAIKKFDPSLGTQFSTYATYWVRQSIIRAIINTGTTIRIPNHMVELILKVKRVEQQTILENQELDIENVCDLVGITVDKYEEVKRVEYQFLNMASLNTHVSDEDDSELGDFVGNEKQHVLGFIADEYSDPVLMVEKSYLREQVHQILADLTDRQQEVIIQRFGLNDGRTKTLEEIGEQFGLTRERIRQIEAKALNRIRARMRKHNKEWKEWIS